MLAWRSYIGREKKSDVRPRSQSKTEAHGARSAEHEDASTQDDAKRKATLPGKKKTA